MVSVFAVAVRTTRLQGGVTDYSVQPVRSAQLPGIAGNDTHFALPDAVRELCASGGCDLVFSVEARPLDDSKASPLKGEGICPLGEGDGAWAGRIEPATPATE
jgi:hypothetical protein